MDRRIMIVHIACTGMAEAERIAAVLVGERLAACVQLRPQRSVYRWQGAIEQAEEVGLSAKTTGERYRALEARVVALHGHAVPEIVAWPVEAVLEAYGDWVRAEVSGAGG